MSLFTAVDNNSLEMLNSNLQQGNINLNEKNHRGETPLLRSIRKHNSSPFISCLIQIGCDVNISNAILQTPLHLAVKYRLTDIVLELIKKGADVNAQDKDRETPLYYAICLNNIEVMNILLYYGSDLTITSNQNRTPLMRAMQMSQPMLLIPLISYYNEFCYINELGDTDIANSIEYLRILGWDNCEDTLFLRLAMHYKNLELFKLIWSRIDYKKLTTGHEAFLKVYFEFGCFTKTEWKECTNLILESPHAIKLVSHYSRTGTSRIYRLIEVLNAFKRNNIEKNERLAVLYALFSLGLEISSYDIAATMVYYGAQEEYQACIYAGNYCGNKSDWKITFHTFVLSLEEDCDTQKVFNLFSYSLTQIQIWYRFFSMPSDLKERLFSPWADIAIQLAYMPEFPTLLELARNAAQKFIRNTYKGKILKPYYFHDIVENLCLPTKVKNIILFKQHIY